MKLRHATIDPKMLEMEEEKLLEEWKKKTSSKFIPDGCPNPRKYADSPIRLLFVLKEANEKNEGDLDGFDIREHMRDGGNNHTWKPIAQWIEGIFSLKDDEYVAHWDCLRDISVERRQELLSSVCAANIKKNTR